MITEVTIKHATLVDAALQNYEFSCEWSKAVDAVKEAAQEEKIKLSRGEVFNIISTARLRWEGYRMEASNAQ
tara:strand:- start:2230 stop:2445 length:216 start_codon:yes stop_codon:yes gene_type:complete